MEKLLLFGGLIVILCIISIRFSTKFNIPSLLIFVVLGMLLGSDGLFKIPFDNFDLSYKICTLSLIYIMFYGGFCMNWKKARPISVQAGVLSTVGVVLTCILVGLFSYKVVDTSLMEGLLIGAVLSSTDAASVFNILRMRKLNLKGGIASVLEMESGSNDPFAYMLTIIVLGLIANDGISFPLLIFSQITFGVGFGFLTGYLGLFMIRHLRFKEEGILSIFVAMIALLGYTLPSVLNGNGFLSVYIAGIILGNAKLKNKVPLVHFFDAITQMMQIVLFFFMGLLASPSQIPSIFASAIAIFLALTFLARPISIFLCLSPFKLAWNQTAFIAWSGLRGAASIVFAIMTVVSPIYTKIDIFHIVFFVSLLSLTFQGGLLPLVARKLDVIDEENDIRKTFNDYIDDKPLELISLPIAEESHWVGRRLQDITFPEHMLAVSVIRGEETILPKGNTLIQAGDTLVICGPSYEGHKIYLEEIEIDKDHEWSELTLSQIDVSNDFLIVMIKRKDDIIIPKGDVTVKSDDILVMCKKEEEIFVL